MLYAALGIVGWLAIGYIAVRIARHTIYRKDPFDIGHAYLLFFSGALAALVLLLVGALIGIMCGVRLLLAGLNQIGKNIHAHFKYITGTNS
jgi:hypothetical protein